MKKVLFFVESLSGGGAEKVLTDLVANLDASKYDITVCSLVDIGVYKDYLSNICTYKSVLAPESSYKTTLQKKWYGLKYKLIRKLPPKTAYSYCFKEKFDIEIAFIEGFATKIIAGSSNSKSKKIAWIHTDLQVNNWTETQYKNLQEEKKAYLCYDHIVSVAESVQKAFSEKFNITKKLIVKYNPIDRESIIDKAKEQLFDENNNKVRLITVGRLVPQKGYDRLLEVIFKLKSDGLDFELWIVGEGPERKILEDYIKEYKLQDIVKLKGFQKNPYPFINNSDVFVCSSRSEGFSTVVTEALILGKPVITTDCSGMKELLGNDNEYGIITENNTQSLYVDLKKILEDESLRTHYAIKSKERSKGFNIKTMVNNIEELL